ncbi:MAG TPA: hypothetical protein VLW55_02080 [Burkholderiaceae bacterium]|nr:hypothetical protein [Burkholderiaceae bacterium]
MQQQQVLQRRHALRFRGILGEAQKTAQLVPEFRQRFEVELRESGHGHLYQVLIHRRTPISGM